VCNAGGSLPARSATLYVGLDYGATRAAGWENDILPWPQPLVNVLEGDLPPEQMPCGPGGYSWFQTGGVPYVAWAGFGSDVSDSDRQAIIDTFNGMQVGDGGVTPASTDQPGYVLTGGTVGDVPWTLEAAPGSEGPQMALAHTGTAAFDDSPATFSVDREALAPAATVLGATRISWGAVAPEVVRVEFRPDDGSASTEGAVLTLPPSFAASYDAFVVLHDAAQQGRLLAIGADGELGGADTVGVPLQSEPTLEDRRVQSDLRNAYVAAKTYYTDGNTFRGFDPATAVAIEPSLAYNTDAQAVAGEISIRNVGADHVLLAEATEVGDVMCIAEQPDGTTTYGAIDAQNVAECVGGEVAWGQDAQPTETPTAVPDAKSTVNLEGFPSPTTLTVNGTDGSCLSIEIVTESASSAVCPPVSDPRDSFATILRLGLSNGSGPLVLVGSTGARAADRVFLVAADGTRTQAPILYTLQAALTRQYFAFPVETATGTLHIEDVNGNQLSAPIKVEAS
jgi:hypothetical protein